MKILVVDDEYIAVEGVMNGVNWECLGFEQIFQAYSYSEARPWGWTACTGC